MKKLPLTFGAALQIAAPPHKARKKVNLTKLANADTGTDPPDNGSDLQETKSILRTSDPFVH